MKNQTNPTEDGEPVSITTRDGLDTVTTQVSGREPTENEWEAECAEIVASFGTDNQRRALAAFGL